jgi:integrase
MAQKRIDYISFEEFEKIYDACKDKKLKLCILLGFGSGLRISEIVGYKRKFKRKKNKETKQIELIPDDSEIPKLTADKILLREHQIRLEETKGKKWRITVTPPSLTERMLNLLPINVPRRTIQHQFEQLTKKVLGKKMSFHTLRHGFGNYQANILNVPLPIVQSMMGHSRLDTTGIYTKANPIQAIETSWKAMINGN